jgi:hypothetical protein
MTGLGSSSAYAASQTDSLSLNGALPQVQPFVGDHPEPMSDQEREAHIKACGVLMEDAMQRYYETGDFGHRGEADRWRLLMQEAIKGRSPEQVKRMEQERGLA